MDYHRPYCVCSNKLNPLSKYLSDTYMSQVGDQCSLVTPSERLQMPSGPRIYLKDQVKTTT